MWDYSEKVMDHYRHPRNVGTIEDADAVGTAGSLVCGDQLKIYLKIKDNIAYKYTSKLERTVNELNNCAGCKSLLACKNPSCGMVFYPSLNNEELEFNYVACKYLKKHLIEVLNSFTILLTQAIKVI